MPQKSEKAPHQKVADHLIHGYVKEALGPEQEPDLGKAPFTEREENEQLDLWYDFFDLVAERRLLVKERKEEAPKQSKRVVRLPGGQFLAVPPQESDQTNDETGLVAKKSEQLAGIKEKIGEYDTIPGFREAYESRLHRTVLYMRALKKREKLEQEEAVYEADRKQVLEQSDSRRGGEPIGRDRIHMAEVTEKLAEVKKTLAEFDSYELGFNLNRFSTLHKYVDAYNNDMLMPVPTVEQTLEWAQDHLDKRQHVVLAGHLGSGKTAMAVHLAKVTMLKNGFGVEQVYTDPQGAYKDLSVEVFSGSYEASIYDLMGKLKLKVKGEAGVASALDELRGHEDMIATYEKENGVPIDRSDLASALAGKTEAVETFTEYGPLARALRDGKPCIIDEFNRMRPEIVARLNIIALAQVGSKVRIQENGDEEFEIKPGFVLILTANLGEKYENLQAVDAAFAGRLANREVDYPQVDETYDLLLSALINRDRLRLPSSFPAEEFPKIANLAVTAREVQEIFAGKTVGRSFAGLASQQAVSAQPQILKGGVLSPRDLMRRIIGNWREEGFKRSLDEVVADEYISSQIYHTGDRKFLTEIFLRRGFFADWTPEKFQKHGLIDLSQQEIDTLRSEIVQQQFSDQDQFAEAWQKAKASGQALERDLSIGVRKRNK